MELDQQDQHTVLLDRAQRWNISRMDKLIARRAIMEDWPGIEALMSSCYKRWKIPIHVHDDLHWLVAEQGRRIVAAVGYQDTLASWGIDGWYALGDALGRRGSSAILKLLFAEADKQQKPIFGVSCFEQFLKCAFKRGFQYHGTAIYRMPGGQGCQA